MGRDITFHIDSSRFPLVTVTIPPVSTPELSADFFARRADLAKRGRCVMLADARRVSWTEVDPRTRQLFAHFRNEFDRGPYRQNLLAEAVLTDGVLGIKMCTAYMWMKTSDEYPSQIFMDMNDAENWCLDILRKNGLSAHGGEGTPIFPKA